MQVQPKLAWFIADARVVIDSRLTMAEHIVSVWRSVYYQL